MAALLPPAAGEAARGGLLRAVAVASHAALLIVAAWIHLLRKQMHFTQPARTFTGFINYPTLHKRVYLLKKEHNFSDNDQQLLPSKTCKPGVTPLRNVRRLTLDCIIT